MRARRNPPREIDIPSAGVSNVVRRGMFRVRKSEFWRSTHAADAEPYEAFDRRKIEMALVRAGARGPVVGEIAAAVEPFEGMTTDDIDGAVVRELERRDPETARHWKMKRDYNRSRFKGG